MITAKEAQANARAFEKQDNVRVKASINYVKDYISDKIKSESKEGKMIYNIVINPCLDQNGFRRDEMYEIVFQVSKDLSEIGYTCQWTIEKINIKFEIGIQ